LRNAISLFEQLINNSEINFENIINTLSIISTERLEAFLNKLLNKDNLIINDFQELIDS
jgi:DNA polymerase III gamma/tau subunit